MRMRLLLCNATKNVSTECKISWKSNGEGTLKEGHPLSKLVTGPSQTAEEWLCKKSTLDLFYRTKSGYIVHLLVQVLQEGF